MEIKKERVRIGVLKMGEVKKVCVKEEKVGKWVFKI